MDRQQLCTASAFATIELLRVQPEHVYAETHGALGEAGPGIEDEALRPLFSLALRIVRVGEIAVEVSVAQVQRGFAVFEKAFGGGAHGQGENETAAADQAKGGTRTSDAKAGRADGIAGDCAHCDAPWIIVVFIIVIRRRTT